MHLKLIRKRHKGTQPSDKQIQMEYPGILRVIEQIDNAIIPHSSALSIFKLMQL